MFQVERTDKVGYDEYDSFICFANVPDEARKLHPGDYHEWQEDGWHYNYREKAKSIYHAWVDDITTLKVWELDRSPTDGQPTVILASYNAG